ncbi:MAG: PCMD domain-containing protein, partial [Muribaculaceae bacterium]|nr:PCMD domain-containing protein [Muribaculaceae bacterium]
ITVTVDDSELVIDDIVKIKGAPVFSGIGYDISKPVEGAPGKFDRRSVYVQCLGEFQSLKMSTLDYAALGLPSGEYDFVALSDEVKSELMALGVTYESNYDSVYDTTSARISFSPDYLNTLALGNYVLNFEAVDSYDKVTTMTMTIKVSDAGVVLEETPWQEVYAYRAKLHGRVVKEGMNNPGFRYRAHGQTEWTTVTTGNVDLNESYAIELTGLQPGTQYEYQAIADDFVNSESKHFTTESIFFIPNSSFEYWCNGGFKNAVMPNENANNIFWDSGNQGATMASTVLLNKSSDMVHSGEYSARMASKWCGMFGMGAFSGGNMFSGVCTNVVVSANATAELTYGQPFNGSRPAKLRGWANYRPGSVDYAGDALGKGATDHGQVMVALTTGTMYINPTAGNYFNANDPSVLAFGEVTWTGNFSADGQLQEFVIPISYKDAANNTKATHIILQATASKFADRFVGSTSSVLYIDDLEFVYE